MPKAIEFVVIVGGKAPVGQLGIVSPTQGFYVSPSLVLHACALPFLWLPVLCRHRCGAMLYCFSHSASKWMAFMLIVPLHEFQIIHLT